MAESVNSRSDKVALESEGRALRRKHTIDEAVATKPDQAGLDYGDKVRDVIKRSAS